MPRLTRRHFIAAAGSAAFARQSAAGGQTAAIRPGPAYPTEVPDLVREVVGVSHNNLTRLKEIVDRRPALARAAWDWGFGDWESALGAASHVGNRPIALYLLERGARPTIFSAAMLGQLAVVKAFVEAQPGVQRTRGPHSIPLMSHALAGGADAAPVVEYLKAIGGADDQTVTQPLAPADRDRLVGRYFYGERDDERLDVTVVRENLTVARPGASWRGLRHLGDLEFFPVGAEAVRLRFRDSSAGLTLTVVDGDAVVTATRVARVSEWLR
jgi:hypothetical protein